MRVRRDGEEGAMVVLTAVPPPSATSYEATTRKVQKPPVHGPTASIPSSRTLTAIVTHVIGERVRVRRDGEEGAMVEQTTLPPHSATSYEAATRVVQKHPVHAPAAHNMLLAPVPVTCQR